MDYLFQKTWLKRISRGLVYLSLILLEKNTRNLFVYLTAMTKHIGNACSKKWVLKLVSNSTFSMSSRIEKY